MMNDTVEALMVLKEVYPAYRDIDEMLSKAKHLSSFTDIKIKRCVNCKEFLHKRDMSGSIQLMCELSGELKNSFETCAMWKNVL